MNQAPTTAAPPALRLLPGVVAAALLLVLRLILPAVVPDAAIIGVLGSVLLAAVIFLWWAFFSRAPHLERWSALLLVVLAIIITRRFVDPSIATGMMGMMLYIYATPFLAAALAAGAYVGNGLSTGPRRTVLVAAIFIAAAFWTLLRTNGVMGEGGAQLTWRWSPTAEDKLLAAAPIAPAPTVPAASAAPAPTTTVPAAEPVAATHKAATTPESALPFPAPAWAGFRGTNRDSIVRGVRIATDWTATPPTQLWRRAVGPGWSSFAVAGDYLFTQEQRGEEEVVSCYKASTGEPLWRHRDKTRFWESNGGAGPRSTPTIDNGRLYTMGATGILNALRAADGAPIWSRNVASDTGAKLPMWGFSASPILLGESVIIAAGGHVAAYDRNSGNRLWHTQAGKGSYGSPQLFTIAEVPQVLFLSDDGVASLAPNDGKVLWKHSWPGATILQPAVTPDGGVLITTAGMSGGEGTRRLAVTRNSEAWTVEERWTSRGLKPYFNDIVVHNGYAYGFDGGILSCIDIQDGQRKWKGGRYGMGQLLLLADQDLLLVLSELGEVALVSATPREFTEVARMRALDDKTWNHPALAGNMLYVRNGQEMVAYKLPTQ